MITDDICNKDDRVSRAEWERTKLQYDELKNIRNKGGRIINLGTPWHKEDVFSKSVSAVFMAGRLSDSGTRVGFPGGLIITRR